MRVVTHDPGRPQEKVNGFARGNNAAAIYDGLIVAIVTKETCKDLLKEAGWSEFTDFKKALSIRPIAYSGFLTNQERNIMYQMFFVRFIAHQSRRQTGGSWRETHPSRRQTGRLLQRTTTMPEPRQITTMPGPRPLMTMRGRHPLHA